MPASLPGATLAQNQANPTQGPAVLYDCMSGPKAAAFDARKIASWLNGSPVYANDPLNCSTGALSTGVGFGSPPIVGPISHPLYSNAAWGLHEAGFTDDYVPGQDKPDAVTQSAFMLYIGGGRSLPNGTPNPYAAGALGLCMAGNGGSRDGGASPFTGFPIKVVPAENGAK